MTERKYRRPHRSTQIPALNPVGFDDTNPTFVDKNTIQAPQSVLDRYVRLGREFRCQGRRCWPDGEPYGGFYRKGLRFARLDVLTMALPVEVRRCLNCNEPATKGRFCDECFPHRKAILAR